MSHEDVDPIEEIVYLIRGKETEIEQGIIISFRGILYVFQNKDERDLRLSKMKSPWIDNRGISVELEPTEEDLTKLCNCHLCRIQTNVRTYGVHVNVK